MRIAHISDNHGYLPKLPEDAEVIIHSGDFMPNLTRGNRPVEVIHQTNWCKAQDWEAWLGGRPFLFCPGNHDFIDPTLFIPNALNVYLNPTDQIAGFPFIPSMIGEWNYERDSASMMLEFLALPKTRILVAHCPPWGLLDMTSRGDRIGNTILTNRLNYANDAPELILCGHNHEQGGNKILYMGTTIVNSACTVSVLELA